VSGPEFRAKAANELATLAQDGLPDDVCDMLDRWRLAEWPSNELSKSSDPGTSEEPQRVSSVLWGYEGLAIVPGGRFQVLSAMTHGLLCRKPHNADRWLDMLVDHVEREETITTWEAMCRILGNVAFCSDRLRVQAFLTRLLTRFPGILTSQQGVRLVARVGGILADETRLLAFAAVRGSHPTGRPQAFGELLCLRHLGNPDDSWASAQIDAITSAGADAEGEWANVGIGFVAGKLWREPKCRTRATDLLCRLIQIPSDRVAVAVMRVFVTSDTFPVDQATLRFFRTLAANPEILDRSELTDLFLDQLLNLFTTDTELVCRISEEAIRRRGPELESMRWRLQMAGSALVDISLRLQRSGCPYRDRGLQMFESLLDLNVIEAASAVRVNDRRLVPTDRPIRRSRLTRSNK
jgi:hypothetical protein